jgi:hypothetical protein
MMMMMMMMMQNAQRLGKKTLLAKQHTEHNRQNQSELTRGSRLLSQLSLLLSKLQLPQGSFLCLSLGRQLLLGLLSLGRQLLLGLLSLGRQLLFQSSIQLCFQLPATFGFYVLTVVGKRFSLRLQFSNTGFERADSISNF